MPKILLLVIFLLSATMLMAQRNGVLLVKKKRNNRTVAMFTTGSQITCYTKYNAYASGIIKRLQNDSVVIYNYTTGSVITEIGGRYIDTISRSYVAMSIHDIESIKLNITRPYFLRKYVPSFLYIGGLGTIALNTINGFYFNKVYSKERRLRNALVSLGTATVGYVLRRKVKKSTMSGKKHIIEMITLSNTPK
jgi:hypothetical protein